LKTKLNPQVIITGVSVDSETSNKINLYCSLYGFFCSNWCNVDGEIGHIDASIKPINKKIILSDLTKLLKEFPDLELGITILSGPPGTFTLPVMQFLVKNGSIENNSLPHLNHPAPKRFKQI
jgi:hypothetical protein